MRTDRRKALVLAASLAISALELGACLEPRFDSTPAPSGRCTRCHGTADRPGTDVDKAAPPSDLLGNTDPSVRSVGAHQVHLQASSTHAVVPCTECHSVPDEPDSPGHAESAGPAKVVFGKIAHNLGHAPKYDREQLTCTDTYCHRDAHPVWNAPRPPTEACGTCHTVPPPPPHIKASPSACKMCHANMDAQGQIIDPALHVNGTVEVRSPAQ